MRFSTSGILAGILFLSTSALANPELPSAGLEQRIEFWKKVFTEFGSDDIVLHDRFHVHLIYDVANDGDVDAKQRAVTAALREIRANLNTPEGLSPDARRIRTQIALHELPLSAAFLDELAAGVHRQRGIKELFRDGVVRSGRYVAKLEEILHSYGVPQELALLPLIESSFRNVRSRAGAAGIWQFIRTTGRENGLRIQGNVDDRNDVIRATQAAGRLLIQNFRSLGNWPLAITAYNHGRGGMLRARQSHGSDITVIIGEYRGANFGYASMNFYPEFLAAVEVYRDYPLYFGQLVLDVPDAPELMAGNPALTGAVMAAAPAGASTYQVQRGDTLSGIAQRFGTSIRELMEQNGLSGSIIYAGQWLSIP